MAATIRLVQGDDLPGVSFTIRDANRAAEGRELDRKDSDTWRPVDLTDAVVTAVVSPIGENRQIDTVLVSVVTPLQGEVALHLNDCTFLENPGQYECEITVNFTFGQQTVYDTLTFDVRERINAPTSF